MIGKLDISIEDLNAKELTTQELQAVIIKLVDRHNAMVSYVEELVSSGRIRSKTETILNQPYGL